MERVSYTKWIMTETYGDLYQLSISEIGFNPPKEHWHKVNELIIYMQDFYNDVFDTDIKLSEKEKALTRRLIENFTGIALLKKQQSENDNK